MTYPEAPRSYFGRETLLSEFTVSKKYLLKYKNLDLTRDINDRLTKLVMPGVISGGEISGVPSQLKVNVAPWKVINRQGMVAEETSDLVALEVQRGQNNVVALKVLYLENDQPSAELVVIEASIFAGLPDLADYIVLGKVAVPLSATEVVEDYIDRADRMTIDPVQRNRDRGTVTSVSALPAKDNRVGDTMLVCDGVGGPTNIYGWNGFTWIVMTDFVQLQLELTQHRQNIYANEKHLTDSEKLAVQGTSGTAVSNSNRLVDNADTRIPTQSENDALVGSHGAPGTSNKYVTQALAYAQPVQLDLASGLAYVEIALSRGPVFIGKGNAASVTEYFRLFHATDEREYLNSDSSTVDVVGVYRDPALTQLINPGAEPVTSVDQDGFFIEGTIYVKLSQTTDLPSRIFYGQRDTLGTYNSDFLMDNPPNVAQTHRKVIQKFEEVSGRKYDEVVPNAETNIELRKELVDVKQFMNTNTPSDFVVTMFKKMNNIPEYEGMFEENLGLEEYTFENSAPVSISYNSSTGTVTYSPSVVLSGVLANHVFIDGAGVEYPVLSVGSSSLVIRNRLGEIPSSISTALDSKAGYVKKDNNPRQINLSDCNVIQFRERIAVTSVSPVLNEYHPSTGQLAFESVSPLRSMVYREPRLRAYGNLQVRTTGGVSPKTQVYSVNEARFMVTGIFTDLEMVADIRPTDPSSNLQFQVIVDGGTPFNVTVQGKTAGFSTFARIQQRNYPIVAALADRKVHTVEVVVPNYGNEFVFYGFDLIRRNFEEAVVSSGRMFVNGDLVYKDQVTTHPLSPVPAFGRGGVSTMYYGRDFAFHNPTTLMTEFDGALDAPGGSAVSGSNIVSLSSGATKFSSYYKVGDIVKVATSTQEETRKLTGVTGGVATFDTNLSITGVCKILHICSTTGYPTNATVESRRITAENTGLASFQDFENSLVADRFSVLEDGVTKFICQQMTFTKTGIEGYERGLKFHLASSRIRISACATHIEMIVATASSVSFSYTVNGSPIITKTSGSTGYRRVTLVTNGRFQSYEIDIFNSTGLIIAGFIFGEPASQEFAGVGLGEIKYLARYQATNLGPSGYIDGQNYPVGAIGFDASSSFVRYVNGDSGNAWSSVIDFSKLWGYYTSTNQEGAYFEFDIYGEAFEFEYTATNNSCIPQIYLNGVIANSTNYPAVYRGINSANGEIDMYSAIPTRKRAGISGLSYGKYTVKVICRSVKNPSSTNYFMSLNQIFHANSTGFFGYANQLARSHAYYMGYSNTYDLREFGNGVRSIDDMIPLVGQAYGLTPELVQDTITRYIADLNLNLVEPTGVGKDFWGTTVPEGWILADGRTIGNTISGATNRANSDTFPLFRLLWESYSDTTLPIYTSSGAASERGLSAQVDFDAGKRLTVIDKRGRVSAGLDNMGGTTASRLNTISSTTLGASGGAQTHTLTIAQMPTHTHIQNSHTHSYVGPVRTNGFPDGAADVGYDYWRGTETDTTGGRVATNQDTGGGQAHNNIQPTVMCNYIIKL